MLHPLQLNGVASTLEVLARKGAAVASYVAFSSVKGAYSAVSHIRFRRRRSWSGPLLRRRRWCRCCRPSAAAWSNSYRCRANPQMFASVTAQCAFLATARTMLGALLRRQTFDIASMREVTFWTEHPQHWRKCAERGKRTEQSCALQLLSGPGSCRPAAYRSAALIRCLQPR